MARFVQILRKIWTDDKFPFFNDDLKLVWFHLQTTPFSTPFGLICASAESLASEMRWSADRYKKRLREGEEAGCWMFDEKRHVVYFRNYWKHNKPGNPSILANRLESLEESQPSTLLFQCLRDLEASCRKWGDGYLTEFNRAIASAEIKLTPVGTPVITPVGTCGRTTETDTETDTNTEKKLLSKFHLDKSANLELLFEKFWEAYPRKESRKAAWEKFKRLKPNDLMLQKMLNWLAVARNSDQWQDKRFIPLPATWLFQRRWEGDTPPMGCMIRAPAVPRRDEAREYLESLIAIGGES